MSKHTHCRWQLGKGSWISNDVKDENRCVWVLESDYLNMKESLEAENARLKAEVERLKNTDPQSITDVDIKANPEWAMACFQFHRENERAEIARLRKAGDNLERVLTSKVASYEVANASYEWRAAKKGEKSE